MEKFALAENEYQSALAIRRGLIDEPTFEEDLASTLNNLGNVHKLIREFSKAGEEFEEALKIYRLLVHANPEEHKQDVAMTLNNLGSLNVEVKEFVTAERNLAKH